jgi:hypothetical protein
VVRVVGLLALGCKAVWAASEAQDEGVEEQSSPHIPNTGRRHILEGFEIGNNLRNIGACPHWPEQAHL